MFMFVTPLLEVLVQPIVFSNVAEARLVQPEKAWSPIAVTLSGMVIEVKDLHPSKALLPMFTTLSGMFISCRAEQLKKA
jgi:hypothetical protein